MSVVEGAAPRAGICDWRTRHAGNYSGRLLQPGHQRGVDDVRNALAADRLDRQVHVLQRETVGGDFLQREALRGELRERELARLVAVAARAFDGDELHRDALEREVGEFLE